MTRLSREDQLRQWLLDRRSGRKHGKRHAVNKRRSKWTRAKAQKAKHNAALKLAKKHRRSDAVSAYWRGELDQHPT